MTDNLGELDAFLQALRGRYYISIFMSRQLFFLLGGDEDWGNNKLSGNIL